MSQPDADSWQAAAADNGAPPPPPPGPVFVSHREARQPASRSSRKAGYHLEFMLVHADGGETLAAVGDDAGDAHYRYVTAPGFAPPPQAGPLRARNRRDLQSWLDAVIKESQDAAGFHVTALDDEGGGGGDGNARGTTAGDAAAKPAASASPPPVPAYIAYRYSKTEGSDGRRRMKWWLVDAAGVEVSEREGGRGGREKHALHATHPNATRTHPLPPPNTQHAAAVGEERGVKDGHYTYRTLASLPGGAAIPYANQASIVQYLEAMIAGSGPGVGHEDYGGGGGGGGGGVALPAAAAHATHTACVGARTPAPPAGASLPPADGDGPPQPTVADLAAAHPAGRAGLAAALAAALPRDNALDGVAAASLATRTRADAVARETAARAAVAAEARARAARSAAGLTAAKRVAVGWLRRAPAGATVARARAAAAKLSSALDALDAVPAGAPPDRAAPPLIAAHDALRDVAGVAVGPKLAAGVPDIVAATTRAAACREATVAAAADRVLASWRAAAGARLAALTRRAALADPEEEVEAVLAAGAATIDAAARARAAVEGEAAPPLEVKEEPMQVG